MAMSHQERAGRILVHFGAALLAEARGDAVGSIRYAERALDLFVEDETFARENAHDMGWLLDVAARAAERHPEGKALFSRVLEARLRLAGQR